MKSIFTRSLAIVALAGAGILATGAAQANPDPRATAKAPAEVGGNMTSPEPSMQQRYCVKEASTGSRIARKFCQTREEWIRDGWDPAKTK